MKILVQSHFFYPSVGGIESISLILAHEFVNLGHSVKLITQTPCNEITDFPFEVIRQPTKNQLFKLVHWCDVFFHNNISLQVIWPLILIHKPWVVAHHTWISRIDRRLSWQDYLKHFLLRFATCISVSKSIADHLSTPSRIIGNPYHDDLFYEIPGIARNKELVFLGRLVSDKGLDLLIKALAKLKAQGLTPQLTVIGAGPEEIFLDNLAKDLDVFDQIKFLGVKREAELVELLNAHQIMVIPSRWLEPFGVVALEGIACGCVVVGSEGGGLKDAIGPCGITFPNGDVDDLSRILANLLRNPARLSGYREKSNAHLSHYKKDVVARAYLEVMEEALESA